MAEPTCVWLYAAVADIPGAGLSQLTGVGGRPVRAVTATRLAAIASDVGLDEFGESGLRANLEDIAWLEATATAHHAVIDAVSHDQPVVPMRLATVYSGDTSVRAMLSEREEDLRAVLRHTRARKEWGVKAYAAGTTAESVADGAGSGAGRTGSGAEYLRRRRNALTAHTQARHEALASAERIHRTLSQFTAAWRLHPPQAPPLAGTKALMVLNAAYLVDTSNDGQFSAVVHRLAEQHPAIKLQLTGPWPPYSFAGLGSRNGEQEDGQ